MDKNEKEIMRFLVQKELDCIKKLEEEIEFPELKFLKSVDVYERHLKEMLKKLK